MAASSPDVLLGRDGACIAAAPPTYPVPEYKLCAAGYGSENRSFSGSAASAARRSVSARAAR